MSEELSDGEYKFVRIGSHLVSVRNNGGNPEINIRDHADFMVEGEHKGDVEIAYTSGEWGATFEQIGEREYWERYHK